MDREKQGSDANCKNDLSNLQQMIAELKDYVKSRAESKQLELATAIRQSQHRLVRYKDLLLHRPHIEESELLLVYTELSRVEKTIAREGIDALSCAIDELEKELH